MKMKLTYALLGELYREKLMYMLTLFVSAHGSSIVGSSGVHERSNPKRVFLFFPLRVNPKRL
jgi:hypothetical protein